MLVEDYGRLMQILLQISNGRCSNIYSNEVCLYNNKKKTIKIQEHYSRT